MHANIRRKREEEKSLVYELKVRYNNHNLNQTLPQGPRTPQRVCFAYQHFYITILWACDWPCVKGRVTGEYFTDERFNIKTSWQLLSASVYLIVSQINAKCWPQRGLCLSESAITSSPQHQVSIRYNIWRPIGQGFFKNNKTKQKQNFSIKPKWRFYCSV